MEEVLNQYFEGSHTPKYFASSDRHRMTEGDPYIMYTLVGKHVLLWVGGDSGEVCVHSSTDPGKIENVIKTLIFP